MAARRDRALDALRGFIVVVMALDHANLFIAEAHSSGEHWFRMPEYDTALPFLTRLVTHPAAPGFFFLMGVGMVLFADSRRARGWPEGRIVRHFLVRGTMLIALQFTVVNLAWLTGPGTSSVLYFGVLAALGGTMIIASAALRWRIRTLAIAAAALFVGVELTHPDAANWQALFGDPMGLILGYSGGTDFFWSNYPVLPWLEVVLLGMVAGKLVLADREHGYRIALWLGVAFLAGFAALRAVNGFGNITDRQGGWIGFFNVVKYPPAMTFTLLTMGLNLTLLSALAHLVKRRRRALGPLVVFGGVPLFFYITHLYLYSLIGRIEPGPSTYQTMYFLWLVGLAILYPACVWFAATKQRHPDSLLRFL